MRNDASPASRWSAGLSIPGAPRRLRLVLSVALLGVVIAAPDSAWAWASAESSVGKPLFWRNRSVIVLLNEACSDDVPQTHCTNSVVQGLLAWNAPECSNFRFLFGGLTDETEIGYDAAHPTANINLLTFVESDWARTHPDDTGGQTVASTTVTFKGSTGEIYDADIEFNGDLFSFASSYDPNQPQVPAHFVQAITAHELGHVLGLADIYDPTYSSSTMYGVGSEGETYKMDLATDDIEGLCTVYPGVSTMQNPFGDGALSTVGLTNCTQVNAPTSVVIAVAFLFLWIRRRRLERSR